MKFFFTLFLNISLFSISLAQSDFLLRQSLQWAEQPMLHALSKKQPREFPYFKGAIYSEHKTPTLPVFIYRFPLESDGTLNAALNSAQYTPLSIRPDKDHSQLSDNLQISAFVTQERDKYFGNIKFIPIRKVGNNLEKIADFELRVNFQSRQRLVLRGPLGKRESVLKDGDIYKFSIKESGVFKLDYDFLKNQLKIANIDQIDPRTIKLYGNGGGMLPESNAADRPDDLTENAITISGEADGKFDASDFLLFYGIGADKWHFDAKNREFNRPKNVYANETFYYLKINTGNGLRAAVQNSVANPIYNSVGFNDYARFEEDKINLFASQPCNCTQGTGKMWFGDAFVSSVQERTYTDKFKFPNIIAADSVRLRVQFAGITNEFTNFTVTSSGQNFLGIIYSSGSDPVEGKIADMGNVSGKYIPNSDNIDVKVAFPSARGNLGWLDYIQVNARRRLQFTESQMGFRDVKSVDFASVGFNISNVNSNTVVWDITNPQQVKLQEFALTSNQLNFGVNTAGVLREFVAFDKSAPLFKPVAVGKMTNQNLHAFDNIDLLIVYHKDFENAAKTLAEQRRKVSNFAVGLAEVSQIYNEFSSGALDPSAIRDFARLLHTRSTRFKYMLLLGDGSFDYKRLYPLGNLQPSDFIPPYETDYDFDAIDSYPSDDYYALLSDIEGGNELNGDLDIGVGRIVCKTATEADAVVQKIVNYESPASLGDWRNRALFMADDEDSNFHMNDADNIANNIFSGEKNFNLDKLYVDAFPQVVSAGGTRVPALNDAVFQNQFKGVLTMCYLGHGGPKRLAQEAVITREELETWRNIDKLPLFITATCSFCGYDNPKEEAAGEIALLNPKGGAIALLSTVRAVYATSNAALTTAVFDTIYKKVNNRAQTFGEIITNAKNASSTGKNGHKFTLIGDPSMRLALPRFTVVTSKVNNKAANSSADTVRALQRITIEGTVVDDNGQILKTFNGTIYPTVYDKASTQRTLGQDPTSFQRDFIVQRNIIFKGAATVKNGEWKFSFIVPKDIDYSFSNGKVSYYATDGSTDAAGNFENFIIGGTDPSVSLDKQPPLVQVYMNDDNFVFGGTTDPNPTLFVKLSDDNGINVAGTSIGHDLAGTFDESKNTVPLNNFYEAVKDDPTKGVVRYPFSKLALGKHKVKVKAWDVANNPGEGYTEFLVASSAKAALAHVLNYPNPFTTKTKFQFEHNLVGQQLRVRVNIFTVSGKIVKTIDQNVDAEGYRVTDIDWDGKDDYGGDLARGVYLYKVKIFGKDNKGQKLNAESDFEKLVILK